MKWVIEFIRKEIVNITKIKEASSCYYINEQKNFNNSYKSLLINKEYKYNFWSGKYVFRFSMKLRKHINNKRLEKIQQMGVDRVVGMFFFITAFHTG